jgi:hypothetical protein
MGFVILVLCLFLIALIGISSLVHGPWAGEGRASLLGADTYGEGRNTATLWGLIVLAIVYSGLLRYLPTLTGVSLLDGGIGVALGLYICAHPAANAVNMLFFERDRLYQMASDWPLIRWLALNLTVLLAGWMAIFSGIRELVDRPT